MQTEIPKDLIKIMDILSWAESRMSESEVYLGHGFDNYWDEALAMMLKVLDANWEDSEALLQSRWSEASISSFQNLLQKRIVERMPLAYLVNEAWFCGKPYYVNKDVLIPRSPLAELIADNFSLWFNDIPPDSILDLCTGSACIAIACALQFENAQVDAGDISDKALIVALKNQERYALQDRLGLYQSDLFKQLPKKRYDLIISNPPYVDALDMVDLPKEYLHEPRMALEAGEDGLTLVRKILKEAPAYLKEGGVLLVEVGNSQEALEEQMPQLPFLWLEFAHGGHGVFAITREQLLAAHF
jgi:ribosomal protein L3 glutamine methyltransferase